MVCALQCYKRRVIAVLVITGVDKIAMKGALQRCLQPQIIARLRGSDEGFVVP
jgi:hypothetical protein